MGVTGFTGKDFVSNIILPAQGNQRDGGKHGGEGNQGNNHQQNCQRQFHTP
jgi:hypothetical protein